MKCTFQVQFLIEQYLKKRVFYNRKKKATIRDTAATSVNNLSSIGDI
ncbi:MAG: hypothetical protein ABI763_16195 [Bacteroidota bacterium]